MTIIFLNKDKTVHHVETDQVNSVCPCYMVDRNFPDSRDLVSSPGVYGRTSTQMLELQQEIHNPPSKSV